MHKEIAAGMKPGDYLRNFREAHGMTQKDLAEKIGVRVNYLSDLETGQRAISRMKARIATEIKKMIYSHNPLIPKMSPDLLKNLLLYPKF